MSESGLNLVLFGAILFLQQQLFSYPKLYRLIKREQRLLIIREGWRVGKIGQPEFSD